MSFVLCLLSVGGRSQIQDINPITSIEKLQQFKCYMLLLDTSEKNNDLRTHFPMSPTFLVCSNLHPQESQIFGQEAPLQKFCHISLNLTK